MRLKVNILSFYCVMFDNKAKTETNRNRKTENQKPKTKNQKSKTKNHNKRQQTNHNNNRTVNKMLIKTNKPHYRSKL